MFIRPAKHWHCAYRWWCHWRLLLHQSARMSEIKNVHLTWMAKCNQLTPLPFKGLMHHTALLTSLFCSNTSRDCGAWKQWSLQMMPAVYHTLAYGLFLLTSVDAERAFSAVGDLHTKICSRLSDQTVCLLHSFYRSAHRLATSAAIVWQIVSDDYADSMNSTAWGLANLTLESLLVLQHNIVVLIPWLLQIKLLLNPLNGRVVKWLHFAIQV